MVWVQQKAAVSPHDGNRTPTAEPRVLADDSRVGKFDLHVEGLSKAFGSIRVLSKVSFDVPRGEVTALLGPSGSGKTTLGEIIAGITMPDEGVISIDEVEITRHRAEQRGISLAPQEWELFPHLSVFHNVDFGLWTHGVPRHKRTLLAISWLERMGIGDKVNALPHQLSGGQQQRVALARALATPAGFAVLDEPFANVDRDTRRSLREIVRDQARGGKGILLITHDREDALLLADTLVCIHQGRVIQSGTPKEIYEKPNSLSAARLTGEASFVPAEILQSETLVWIDHVGATRLSRETLESEHRYDLILRPEWLEIVEDSSFHFEGTATKCDYQGAEFLVTVEIGDVEVLVRSRRPVSAGAAVHISVREGALPPVIVNG